MLHLRQNIRVANADGEGAFADYLGKVREGTLPIIEDIGQHTVQLPEELNLGSSRLTNHYLYSITLMPTTKTMSG